MFLAQAALLVMLGTLASRFLGFGRELITAAYFGAEAEVDAYTIAFIAPNFLRMLLADAAIGAAFIPVVSGYLAKGQKEDAWIVGSSVTNIMLLVLGIMSVLGIVLAPYIVPIIAPGFVGKPETFDLTVVMMRIMFPSVLIMGLSGLVMGMLHSYDHFTFPAFAPLFFNIVIIGMIIIFAGRLGIISLAIGVTVGAIFQLIFQLPVLIKKGIKYFFKINWSHPGVRQVGLLVVPVMLTLGSIEINLVVDNRFASALAVGSVSALRYSIRLWQMPFSLFGVTIATVLFPTLSKQAAVNDISNLRQTFSLGTRLVFLILIPATMGLIILRTPIVRLVFERGEFTPLATKMTAIALMFYSIGLFAYGAKMLIDRTFYALRDSKTPMIIALISILLNYIGDWILMRYLGHGGIALTTSIVSIFNLLILVEILRRRLGRIEGKKIVFSIFRILLASILMIILVYFIWSALDSMVGRETIGQVISLGSAIFIAFILYLLFCYLLKVEELSVLYNMIKERFSQKRVNRQNA